MASNSLSFFFTVIILIRTRNKSKASKTQSKATLIYRNTKYLFLSSNQNLSRRVILNEKSYSILFILRDVLNFIADNELLPLISHELYAESTPWYLVLGLFHNLKLVVHSSYGAWIYIQQPVHPHIFYSSCGLAWDATHSYFHAYTLWYHPPHNQD